MSVAIAETFDDSPSPAVTQFYQAIQAQLTAQVGSVLQATVVPVAPNGQGDFPYQYQNGNLDFNAQTYPFIAALAGTGDLDGAAYLTPSQFPATMLALFRQIEFHFSSADQVTSSNARQAAQLASSNLVQTYAGQYGPIPDAQIASAVSAGWLLPGANRFDYIVQVIVGGVWAGLSKPPGLTLTEMQNAENLSDLLPDAPADAGSILSTVSAYVNALGPATALLDQQNDAQFHVHQIVNALANPQAGTNGVTTFDPNGVLPSSVLSGFSINKPAQMIVDDLSNTSRVITVSASVQQSSNSQKTVSINGSAAISLSEDDGLVSFDGGTNFQYNMESVQGSGSEIDVTISYEGWSDVPVQPMPLVISGGQPASVLGWYAPQLLKEAYRNWQAGSTAPTGLTFPGSPGDLDRFPMGDFNFLSTILITNHPTITLHYTAGNYEQFQESLATQTQGSVSILGIPVASVSINTYSMDSHQNSSSSDFTVTLTPTPPTNVPPLLVTAHVIGGVVTSPAV